MTDTQRQALQLTACKLRRSILDATHAAKSGHPGGSLGAADLFTILYFNEMHIDPAQPNLPARDRFVLSKGHCAPGLYAALAHRGYFPVADLLTLRHIGSHLQGHPSMNNTPGVDMSTGSLGQGISAACGMALAAKIKGENWRVYALLGDGEIEEGECWEAFMFAAHYKLDNLCVIIDINGLQIDGPTADVMSAQPIDEKMAAFGFEVIPVDGHNFDTLDDALNHARQTKNRPTVLLANTVKGKGVCFMENVADWHGKAPGDDDYRRAADEVDAMLAQMGGAHHG